MQIIFGPTQLVGQSTSLVQSEMSGQLLDGLSWIFVQTLMVPRGKYCWNTALVIIWRFILHNTLHAQCSVTGRNDMQKQKSYCDYYDRYCDCDMSHNFSRKCNFCISFSLKKMMIWFLMICRPLCFIYNGMLWRILPLANIFTFCDLDIALDHIAISIIFQVIVGLKKKTLAIKSSSPDVREPDYLVQTKISSWFYIFFQRKWKVKFPFPLKSGLIL